MRSEAMGSDMLLSSVLLIAALVWLCKILLNISWSAVLLSAVATVLAISVSSIAIGWLGAADGFIATLVRFVPCVLLLALANFRGLWPVACLQVILTWAILDLIHIAQFAAIPSIERYASYPVIAYLLIPLLAVVLARLSAPKI